MYMFIKGSISGVIWDPLFLFVNMASFFFLIIIQDLYIAPYIYNSTVALSALTAVCLAFVDSLVGLWRCIKRRSVCAGAVWSASYITSHVYLFLPVSNHACTTAATCLLLCNICILVMMKMDKEIGRSSFLFGLDNQMWRNCFLLMKLLLELTKVRSSSCQLVVCICWRIRHVCVVEGIQSGKLSGK